MEDAVLIKKVIEYITSEREQLQVASVFCVTNLMRSSEGDRQRQTKLRELGAEKQLQTLLTTTNSNLFDRYVNSNLFDRYVNQMFLKYNFKPGSSFFDAVGHSLGYYSVLLKKILFSIVVC